jgi:hypothetical protein
MSGSGFYSTVSRKKIAAGVLLITESRTNFYFRMQKDLWLLLTGVITINVFPRHIDRQLSLETCQEMKNLLPRQLNFMSADNTNMTKLSNPVNYGF